MAEPDTDPRFSHLVEWSKLHGGWIHENVEVYRDEVTGVSLRVKPQKAEGSLAETSLEQPPGQISVESSDSLIPGDVAVGCPFATSLSYLNVLAGGQPILPGPSVEMPQSTHVFPDTFLVELPPHVVGRFFLIHEYLKDRQSHWYPYISTLPDPMHIHAWNLPPLWSKSSGLHDLLADTNAESAVKEIRGRLSKEYKRAIQVLRDAGFPNVDSYNKILYNWAFCIFSSRSFRPSTVLPIPVVQEMKRRAAISHPQNALFEPPADNDVDDFSVLLPVLDLGNHDPRAKVDWKLSHTEDCTSISLQVQQNYKPGEQVFNNYGLKTNSELLLGYGFIIPPTPTLHNDYVNIKIRSRGADAAEGESDTKTPQSSGFLLSLRPISNASSVVGKARCPDELDIAPEFSHFEYGLLHEMVDDLLLPEEEATLSAAGLDRSHANFLPGRVKLVFGAGTPLPQLAERVRDTLLSKVQRDFLSMAESDDYYDEEDDPDDHLQTLARSYRAQFRDVLQKSILTLDPETGIERIKNLLQSLEESPADENDGK